MNLTKGLWTGYIEGLYNIEGANTSASCLGDTT